MQKMIGNGFDDRLLTENEIRGIIVQAFSQCEVDGKRVLVIIPDGTRTAPVPLFFRLFHETIGLRARQLDCLIALGTHQPLSDERIGQLVGVSAQERTARYSGRIFNHSWREPDTFQTIGTIATREIAQITGGLMAQDVTVSVNKAIFAYDLLVVLGPVFPHEVAGFSGGNKYFFPGISGPEMIHFTHWLGALITNVETIGRQDTPVRRVIDRAASFINVPKLCFSLVMRGEGVAGLFCGSPEESQRAAAQLSARLHVRYVNRPYRRVLAVIPPMYDDLWTAAKGMYKAEPVVADGGEVVIYAPHVTEISRSHGQTLEQIGYHVRDFYLKRWDAYKHIPWGLLAHSTHLRGMGTYENGLESPRIQVTLATGIPEETCRQVHLGYLNPDTVQVEDWEDREDEGILLIPRAGETLYRLHET